jgi:hypothetical protein
VKFNLLALTWRSCGPTPILEFLGYVGAVLPGIHAFVDVQDLAILTDVKRPALGKWASQPYHAKGLGDLLARITENWVIQIE